MHFCYKNVKVFVLYFTLVLCPLFHGFSQSKVTLSGYIKDAGSGETLIGAAVVVVELGTGTVANPYGFYSLTLAPGEYTVEYRFVGYQTMKEKISLLANLKKDIELKVAADELEEVVVMAIGEDDRISNLEMGVNRLDVKTLQRLPNLLGEVDVIRSIQLLPGVSTVGEGAAGFNVRGGGVDQNLVLLDEAPVYNASHLFGFFSVFNPDAVKDVKLIKGGIPAQYGGRLSSILDVRMREGNNKRFASEGGIGAIFSRLTLEAPIIKDKASFIVAGRRSYADVLARPFLGDNLSGSQFYFYDLTAKVNYNINEKNRIYLSGYFGRDVFSFGDDIAFNWGNATTSFRWNHLFSDRLFSNVTVFYSNYVYSLGFGDRVRDQFDWNSRIINYSIKPEFTYFLNPRNTLTFGGQTLLYTFEPGNATLLSDGEFNDFSLDKKYALESAIYFGNEQTFSNRFSMQYGFRLSHFLYMGPGDAFTFLDVPPNTRRPVTGAETFRSWEPIQAYIEPEPRVSMRYQLNGNSSLKAGYNRMAQYIHLISNGVAASPLDVWTPSSNNIRPQTANQVSLGYFHNFKNNTFETSVEVYYKNFENLVDYIDGADLLLNRFLEGDLLPGIGRAYGAEFYVKKNGGKVNGWISYTIARSERKIEGINLGEWYPNRFDQAHNLRLIGFWEPGKRWSFSSSFTFLTGTPTTFPTNRFEFQGYIIPHNAEDRRNNVRLPVYHRLDFSATLQGKKKPNKKKEDNWVFSIYNAYGRRNPFAIYFQQNANNPRVTEAERLAVVGAIVPSVSYNFKF